MSINNTDYRLSWLDPYSSPHLGGDIRHGSHGPPTYSDGGTDTLRKELHRHAHGYALLGRLGRSPLARLAQRT